MIGDIICMVVGHRWKWHYHADIMKCDICLKTKPTDEIITCIYGNGKVKIMSNTCQHSCKISACPFNIYYTK